MKCNEEVTPGNLGGLGNLLPAEILNKLNELLEQLHKADIPNRGGIVLNYYEKGSQHIDTQINIGDKVPVMPKDTMADAPVLPPQLSTEQAMALWKKAQDAGYVDANYQPLISRTQSALLADAMAERLGIKEKWKVFEVLWNRKNMYRDYYKALNLQQSLAFQDEIKKLFR